MEEIEWNFNAITGEIFPERINTNLRLLYHGTSTIYSADIEQNGFRINHSPFSVESLQEIVNLLADLNEPSDFNPDVHQFNFNHAGAIDHYLHNLLNHPISFTTAGFPALKFASETSKGGQILGKINSALQQIIELISNRTEDRAAFEQRFNQIQEIEQQCNLINNSPGVIYVIEPTQGVISSLDTDHNVIFSRQPIHSQNIIAKVIVDQDFTLPQNFSMQSKNMIKQHFKELKSIGRLISRNQEPIDEEN